MSNREHSITPMAEVVRRIANGWYDRKGCEHYADRLDWREHLCPACKELNGQPGSAG